MCIHVFSEGAKTIMRSASTIGVDPSAAKAMNACTNQCTADAIEDASPKKDYNDTRVEFSYM